MNGEKSQSRGCRAASLSYRISLKCRNDTARLWLDCEMTVVKLHIFSFLVNRAPSSPGSSLQYFLERCRARVGGVSWVFDLAGAHPFSLQASGALHKEKKSPAVNLVLSYPHWHRFIAEFISEKQNMCEWKRGYTKCSRPNYSNGFILFSERLHCNQFLLFHNIQFNATVQKMLIFQL